jgi:hypothetical protein
MVGGATLTGLLEHQLVCARASVALVDSILNDQEKNDCLLSVFCRRRIWTK